MIVSLLSFFLTVLAFLVGKFIAQKAKGSALFSPPVIAISIVVTVLLIFGVSYKEYFEGARWIHYLLGPATVSFALPLYHQLQTLRTHLRAILGSLLAGCTLGVLSAVYTGWIFQVAPEIQISLAPKSVTTPIAMAVSEQIGGVAELTVFFVIFTGIFGAMMAPTLFKVFRIQSPEAKGFALGLSAHGLGTYQAFQMSEAAGAFASLGMALNGIATALLIEFLRMLFPG